ncbi:MAG: YdcF family protein [bacterium]
MSNKEILRNYLWLFLILIFLTFMVLELTGIQQYGTDIYNLQKNQTIPQNPEMIVVLAGSVGRIEAAYELMKGRNIPLLLVAGAYTKVNFDELSKKYHWDLGDKDKIKIDNISTSTWENAKISADFARQHNIKSLVLVTSIYHMQRSEFLFKKVFKSGEVQIIPYAISMQPIEYNSWWHDFKTFKKIMDEFFKYQYYRAIFTAN